jgi:hypothetical protein
LIDPFRLFRQFIGDLFGLSGTPISRKRKLEENTEDSRKKQLCHAVDEVEAALFRLKQVRRSVSASIRESSQELVEDAAEEASDSSEGVKDSGYYWDGKMIEDSQASEDQDTPCCRPGKYGVCYCTDDDNTSEVSEPSTGDPSDDSEMEVSDDGDTLSMVLAKWYDEVNRDDIHYSGTPEIPVDARNPERHDPLLEHLQPPSSPSYVPPSNLIDNMSPYYNLSSSVTKRLNSSPYLHDFHDSLSPCLRNRNPYSIDTSASLSPSTPVKQETPPTEPLSSVKTLRSENEFSQSLFPLKRFNSFATSRSPTRQSQTEAQLTKVKRFLTEYTIAEFKSEEAEDIYVPNLTRTDMEINNGDEGIITEMVSGRKAKVWDAKVVEWGNDKTVRLVRVQQSES